MGRKIPPMNIIFHYPQTEEGKRELAERVSTVHANEVIKKIQKLNCSYEQKIKLLNAVIENASSEKSDELTLKVCSSILFVLIISVYLLFHIITESYP